MTFRLMFQVNTLPYLQTPEGSLLDIMRNAYDLLSSCCIEVPMVNVPSLPTLYVTFFHITYLNSLGS
jgi:hypothetical protein